MVDPQAQTPQHLDWSQGTNNLTPRDRQPAGTARRLVNVDPLKGGKLGLRTDGKRLMLGTNVRGVLALGRKLLIADGADLVEFSVDTNSSRVLRTITSSGVFAGDVINDRLYFCTANEALEYDGNEVRPWGVTDVTAQPPVAATPGGLLDGAYKVAVTYVDQWGREGGTDRAVFLNVTTGGLTVGPVSVPAGHTANVYVGPNSASSLYLQAQLSDGESSVITQLRDDTQRCTTEFKRAPRPGHIVRAANGVIAVATGRAVQLTEPFQPHLVDRGRAFFQYSQRVGEVLWDGLALYTSADKCYRLTNIETREVLQRIVLDFPAIPGSGAALPDGRAAWMTPYGQAVSTETGMELLHRDRYAAPYAESGTAGVVDCNGVQLIVTVMRGRKFKNPLAVKERKTQ